MKHLLIIFLALFGVSAYGEFKMPGFLRVNKDFQAGVQALEDHLPEVAAAKFDHLIKRGQLKGTTLKWMQVMLLETYVRAGRYKEAIRFAETGELQGTDGVQFWRALAIAGEGRLSEAERELRYVLSDPRSQFRNEALLSRAGVLRALNEPEKAKEMLEQVISGKHQKFRTQAAFALAEIYFESGNPKDAERIIDEVASDSPDANLNYLLGKVALSRGDHQEAARFFRSVLGSEQRSIQVAHGSVLGLADALAASGEKEEARQALREFVTQQPRSPLLESAFERLDSLGAFSGMQIDPALLDLAKNNTNEDQLAFASYFLGINQAVTDRKAAIKTYEDFTTAYPNHFMYNRMMLRLAGWYNQTGQADRAAGILNRLEEMNPGDDVSAHIAFLRAQAKYRTGDYEEATAVFEKAARTGDEAQAADARFNAALASLQSEDPKAFMTQFQAISSLEQEESQSARSELLMERGLYLASISDPESPNWLLRFLKTYPEHPRAFEAHLGLAQIYLNAYPPKPEAAKTYLENARKSMPAGYDDAEQIDYVAMWIEESAGNSEKVIEIGNQYLKRWPDSPRIPEVRMKLGEVHYRNNDYPNAQLQFQLLAKDFPNAREAEPALFFAGKAAMETMATKSIEEAIEIWTEVIKRDGPLVLHARYQQAIAKARLNKHEEAIPQFDLILESKPDDQLRYAVLNAKGQALFLLASQESDETEKKRLINDAIRVYKSIATAENVNAIWKHESLYRLGECYRALDDIPAALESFYDILRPYENRKNPPEFEWYYRAGFTAMEILEGREDWDAAVSIAEHMAKTTGPRAQEAAERAKHIRLQRFIWE